MSPSKARSEMVTLRFKNKSLFRRAVYGRDLTERFETLIKMSLGHACERESFRTDLVNRLKAFLKSDLDQEGTMKAEEASVEQFCQNQEMDQPETDPHSSCETKIGNLIEDLFSRQREVLEKLHENWAGTTAQLEDRDTVDVAARVIIQRLQDEIRHQQGEIGRQECEIGRQQGEIERQQGEMERLSRILHVFFGHRQGLNGTARHGQGSLVEPCPTRTQHMDFSAPLPSASTSAPGLGAAITTRPEEDFLPTFHHHDRMDEVLEGTKCTGD